MTMQTLNFRLTGVVPLLMHNGRLSSPMDQFSKEIKTISSKRVKTDDDYEAMARLEFLGGLYLDDKMRPCLPGVIIEGALYGRGGAARKERLGKQAQAGLFCDGTFPLEYEGPKDPDEMWADETMRHAAVVVIKGSRIVRTRAMIPVPWHADCKLIFNDSLVNHDQVIRWLNVAGEEIGLMDWRPKFGRFQVELL